MRARAAPLRLLHRRPGPPLARRYHGRRAAHAGRHLLPLAPRDRGFQAPSPAALPVHEGALPQHLARGVGKPQEARGDGGVVVPPRRGAWMWLWWVHECGVCAIDFDLIFTQSNPSTRTAVLRQLALLGRRRTYHGLWYGDQGPRGCQPSHSTHGAARCVLGLFKEWV